MLASPTPPKRVPRHLTSGLITLIYLLFGTLWIVFSDRLLAILITDAGLLAQVQTIKGEGFILMTALMLYLLIRQSLKRESQIEQALRRSETRLEGIISSATDAILTIDRDQRIILFNEAAETLFEYPTAEMLGQRLDLLLPERYRAGHGGHITRFGQTGRSSRSMGDHGEVMALRADGTEFPIEAMISQTEVGGEKLYTVIIRDITRRKETEAALRSALQTLTLHVENSPLAVIEWDHLFRVRRWSKRAEEIFGWPAAEVLGKHPTEWPFIHPDDAVAVTERMVNLVQQRQARSVHRHRN
jgi:PAS domain S-box-containing protein